MLPSFRHRDNVAVDILIGMFMCEPETKGRFEQQVFFLLLTIATRIEPGPNVPLVQWRTQVVE